MSVPPFLQLRSLTGDAARLQDNLVSWIKRLGGQHFLAGVDITSEVDATGRLVDGVSFTAATEKKVPHKLGKIPTRCFPTRFLSGGATWFESTAADANYVSLTFSANCKVYLRVE